MSLERVCDRCGQVIKPKTMAPDEPYVVSGQDACSVECALILLRGVYDRESGNYFPENWNRACVEAQRQLKQRPQSSSPV